MLLGALAGALAPTASGYSNGGYPRSALDHIAGGSNYSGKTQSAYLVKGRVAAAWNTLNLCATADGVPLSPGPSSYSPAATAYRSYAIQVILRRQLGSNAAPPGTSNHGTGSAVDVRTLAQRRYIDAHGAQFGIAKKWSDASWEWWHLRVRPDLVNFKRPDPGSSFRFPNLRWGSGGKCQAPAVKEVQRRVGVKADGEFGHNTRVAVLKFQKKQKLKGVVLGRVASKTWLALRKKTRKLTTTNARDVGKIAGAVAPARGQDVRAVQGLLNASFKKWKRPRRVTVDGVGGPQTIAAIKRFQQLKHLKITGVVDDKTYAVLLATAGAPKPTPKKAISAAGVKLVASFEGFRSCPYKDVVGVWTIGYGHTGGVSSASKCLSKAQAETLMRRDLDTFSKAIASRIKSPTSSGQYNSMVSLAFNVGAGAFNSSTLLRMHNAKNYAGAANQFRRWNKAGGKVWAGLVRRRAAERQMYLNDSSAAVRRAAGR